MPSSRFNFCAARSNRAAWDSQGLISCSMEMVRICLHLFEGRRNGLRVALRARLACVAPRPKLARISARFGLTHFNLVAREANAEYREGATGRQGEGCRMG